MADNEWQMRVCYTYQTATVKKNLEEGFEPFWGYRCKVKDKDTVRMYFRKAPLMDVIEGVGLARELEAVPSIFQFDSNQFEQLSNELVNVLDNVFNRFEEALIARMNTSVEINRSPIREAMRVGGKVNVVYRDEEVPAKNETESEIVDREMRDVGTKIDDVAEHYENADAEMDDMDSLVQELEDEEDIGEQLDEPPAGDGFRVVEDVPSDFPVQARTQDQDEIIEQLRKSASTNITVYPVEKNGDVRVFSGGDIYIIHPAGTITKQENPAGRDSTAV
jgi:hypothetical protein